MDLFRYSSLPKPVVIQLMKFDSAQEETLITVQSWLSTLTIEYLLKQYLQTSMSEPVYRTMYDHAMNGVKRHLVGYSYPSQFTFVGELPQGISSATLSPKMDHLVCFLGGNFALGATEGKTLLQAKEKGWTVRQQEDLDLGEAITRSCV